MKTLTEQSGQIAQMFEATRAATLALFDRVTEEANLHESPGGGFRPIIWHLAHIGVFEAYWILQRVKGDAPLDARYERIFDPIATPREQSKELPTRREMEDYLTRVRDATLEFLQEAARVESERDESADPSAASSTNLLAASSTNSLTSSSTNSSTLLRDGYIFHLVLEHERQHQETLAYLLHLLDPAKKARATSSDKNEAHALTVVSPPSPAVHHVAAIAGEMVTIPAGEFQMGAPWEMFVYDNELPAHARFIPSFKIDRLLTTNEEFAHFIAEGGYARREWWSAEGWAWRERENWTQPFYWTESLDEEGGGNNGDGGNNSGARRAWQVRAMFEEGALEPQHPVAGVSWYEAEAYARFAGKRLPTEAEWEKAASWDGARAGKRLYAWGDDAPSLSRCNADFSYWNTTPVGSFPEGASASGCLDMTGNVWEWTSEAFAGYENFKAYPYPEYSAEWFDGDHRVLKGGSWATHPTLLRTSFRNFFRRHFRIAFAGLRLAADV